MTKTIGYLVMLGGAVAVVIGLGLIIHSAPTPAIVITLGVLFGAVGWYIARKQPALPGVH